MVQSIASEIYAIDELRWQIDTSWSANVRALETHGCASAKTWRILKETVEHTAMTLDRLRDKTKAIEALEHKKSRFFALNKKLKHKDGSRRVDIVTHAKRIHACRLALQVGVNIITLYVPLHCIVSNR